MLYALLLAAGGSTRFNGIKQLAHIDDQCMLNLVAARFCTVTNNRCLVVLGANAREIMPSLNQQIETSITENWQLGMSASIQHGIQALLKEYDETLSHVLIGLADQIGVDESCLTLLKQTHELYPQYIIAARYNGTLGAPVIFPKKFVPALLLLEEGKGAKSVIHQFIDNVLVVDIPQAAFDIDTPQDLDTWLLQKAKNDPEQRN